MIGLYARVSTQEQALNGHSIDEQIDRMQKFCDAKGWSATHVYNDAGFSGANTNRPALQSLIKDVKSGRISIVLVYKLDRLSRSQRDTLMLIEDVFLANDCDFVSLSENFDTSSPFGRAMIGILSVFAQLEREQIKERMTMGKIARAKQGKYSGSKYNPIGYDYIDGELVTNDFEKMQIIQIFNDFASGMSPQKIADKLNDAGMTHKYGKWIDATVRDVVTKKTYLGYISFNGEWYQGHHEAFIDEDLFNMVQTIKDQRCHEYKRLNRRAGKVNSYLGGFLYCEKCGAKFSKMTKRRKKGGRTYTYYYYVCNSRSQRDPNLATATTCDNKNWKMEDLDSIILGEIKKLSLDPAHFETETPKEDERPAIISHKIKDIESQLSRLMDLYALGQFPVDVLQDKIHVLNDQRQSLADEMERIEQEQEQKMSHEDACRLINSFADILDNGDLEEIHAVIGSLIERIDIDGDDITIRWSFS